MVTDERVSIRTIGDLIEILQSYPQDMLVQIPTPTYVNNFEEIDELDIIDGVLRIY